jgi:type I restriction enzyme M protein
MFHAGEEAKIRRKLMEENLIETVIALGPNLFYGTGIPTCVLVCRREKDRALKRSVYFVDASDLYREYPNQNELV